MFGSTVIEVGIGMALLFLFASLIATAAQEFLEGIRQRRGKDLERGIQQLLNDSSKDGLTANFYNHPLVNSLYPGKYKRRARRLPSYIPAPIFSLALLDIMVASQENSARDLPDFAKPSEAARYWNAAKNFSNEDVGRMVLSALESSNGNVEQARRTIDGAFNAAMDRVSGRYKRRTQWVLATIGLLTAVILNIDAITVVQRMVRADTLRRAVIATAAPTGSGKSVSALAKELDDVGFPIGWKDNLPAPQKAELDCSKDRTRCVTLAGDVIGLPNVEVHGWSALKVVLGWLITALAIMLGAPFWFDVLNKFMVIRSTVKPNEKSPPEGSEDRLPSTLQPGTMI